jgi:hypothetical protein
MGGKVSSCSRLGEVDFGQSTIIDLDSIELDWFMNWLLNGDDPVGSSVRVFMLR